MQNEWNNNERRTQDNLLKENVKNNLKIFSLELPKEFE